MSDRYDEYDWEPIERVRYECRDCGHEILVEYQDEIIIYCVCGDDMSLMLRPGESYE